LTTNETKKRRRNSVVLQGSILALAAVVVRLIGLIYRIPLTNTLTDEGAGLYGTAFTVYMMFLMVSSYGLPAAISKLVAAKLAVGKAREAHAIFKASLWFGLVSGTVFSIILWVFAGDFANLIKSPASTEAIMALAPAVFVFSILAVFRGYFQGMNSMVPTAISQIFEQILNATFSLILGSILVKESFAKGAAGGTMGTGIGAFAALIFMVFVYSITRNRIIYKRIKKDTHEFKPLSMLHYWHVLIRTAFPIIVGTAVLQLTGLIDLMMVQSSLQHNGLTETIANEYYGVYAMKVKVLIRLPITIASALGAASVPSITESLVQKNYDDIKEKIRMAVKTTLVVVIPSAIGLTVMAKPIIEMLFDQQNLDIGAKALQWGTVAIVLFSISTLTIGILQGLDKLKTQAIICLIGMGAKVVLNWLFLYVFNWQLNGVVMSDNIFALLLVSMNMYVINKVIHTRVNIITDMIKPIIASVVMGLITYIIYILLKVLVGTNDIPTLLAILFGGITYIIVIIKIKTLSEYEIMQFPKGASMVRLFKQFNLL
jgi:stage V sporulation protein B